MGTMESDAFKMFLQNIEEYVMDEDKIVTYKWLSKNFDIHVNTAKQLLYSFASVQKNKVHLTYLIGGLLKNGVGGSVQIVREDDIDKIKREFKLVTSEHVYSVQKAKTLPDLNILYTVDVDRNAEKDYVKRLGSIKCDHPVLRSNEEVAGLKRKTQSAAVDTNEKKWPLSKKSTITSPVNGIEDKQVEEAGNSKTLDASSGGNNANKKESKKGGIAAMFAAQSTKTKNQNDAEVKNKRAEVKKPKAENGISAFFNRQVNKPLKPAGPKNDSGVSSQSDSQDSPKKMEVDSENPTDNIKIVEDKTIQHKKDKIMQHKKEDKTTQHKNEDKTIQHKKETIKKEIVSKSKDIKQKSNEKKGGRGKNKKASADKELPPAKKRKRIVVISDSEDSSDDGIFDKEEEDEGMCYSPAPQLQQPNIDGDDDTDVIPPTPEPPLKKGRKRIRKLVDNTYMDKDGYMLTRKEYVFESCTESEPEEEKEKENKSKDNTGSEHVRTEKVSPKSDEKEPSPKKKKVSPQNIKQASIMNFFKKK